jgi:hypothetical protein
MQKNKTFSEIKVGDYFAPLNSPNQCRMKVSDVSKQVGMGEWRYPCGKISFVIPLSAVIIPLNKD